MARDYGDEIGFLGIAGRDSVEAMANFVDHFEVGHLPHAADPDGELWERFGVPYQPAWVFIDSGGNAVRVFGAVPDDQLISILEDLSQDLLPNA